MASFRSEDEGISLRCYLTGSQKMLGADDFLRAMGGQLVAREAQANQSLRAAHLT